MQMNPLMLQFKKKKKLESRLISAINYLLLQKKKKKNLSEKCDFGALLPVCGSADHSPPQAC